MGRKEKLTIAQEVGAIVLLGAGVLILLSLASFDPRDIGRSVSRPIDYSTRNYVGPVGAHLADWAFLIFGVGGYLVPLFLLLWGLALWLEPALCGVWKIVWGAVLLVSVCCLLQDQPWFFQNIKDSNGLMGVGGAVGVLLVNSIFEPILGRAGSAIVFLVLYVIGLIVVIN